MGRTERSPFKGHVSTAVIADGIAAVLQNSRDLLAESKLLREHGHFARAHALSVASLEECGKVSVLQCMANISSQTQSLWRERWHEFRSHDTKSAHGLSHSLPDEARESPLALLCAVPSLVEANEPVEQMRQESLYVDYDSKSKAWLSPADVTADTATEGYEAALAAVERQQAFEDLGFYSVEVLALRAEIYGPLTERLGLKDRESLSKLDTSTLLLEAAAAHEQFFARLPELGVTLESPDEDPGASA